MMDSQLKFLSQETRVFRCDACYQDTLLALDEFGRNFQDLFGCLASAENDFRKSFSQRAMCVHFCKPKVHDRRGLEGAQDFVAAHTAGSKLLEQLDCFSRRHPGKMRQKLK